VALFKDELPLLSPNSAIDEQLGIEVSVGSKLTGSWNEILYSQYQSAIPTAGSIVGIIMPYPCELVGGSLIWSVASASGTIQLVKDTGTTAPGAGTALLGAAIPTSTTANTVFFFPKSQAFVSNSSILQFARGDRLDVTFAGTFTAQANLVVIAQLKRI
jgi:hypothetical protein